MEKKANSSLNFFAIAAVSLSSALIPPSLSSLLKPQHWKRMLDEKDVIVSASLKDHLNQGKVKKYSFYAAMVVRASLDQTHQVITNYRLYSEMIPYVDKTVFTTADQILHLEAGIWNYRMNSEIFFEQPSQRKVQFQVIGGHFAGLIGEVLFESLGERGTAVLIRGEQIGRNWPPEFVLERGAEVVFRYTANKMRSLIESEKQNGKKIERGMTHAEKESQKDPIPTPRSHF